MKKVPKVCTPPQPDDIARLTSMKKNKNDQIGGQSMQAIADGYDTNDKIIPSNVIEQISPKQRCVEKNDSKCVNKLCITMSGKNYSIKTRMYFVILIKANVCVKL